MPGRECFHCKQWVEEGEAHDCWTTTESALTRELPEDLQDAYARLREAAVEFGEQRIYASHHCIMFSRKACYFFVRPKSKALELCIFLGRALKAPQVKRVTPTSRTKVSHIVHIAHRDEVEPPITDWLREAYEVSETLSARQAAVPKRQAETTVATKGRTQRNRKAVKSPGRRKSASSSKSAAAPKRASARKVASPRKRGSGPKSRVTTRKR